MNLRTKRTVAKNAKVPRYFRNVGLGFKTPDTAVRGSYIDKKCPFTGNVSIRGRILRGVVVSTKMKRTIVLRRDYLHYIKKYNRFEKRHTNIPAHMSPAFLAKEGDVVTVGQCRCVCCLDMVLACSNACIRPLSKTVRFNVLKVEAQRDLGGTAKKQFRQF